MGVKGLKKYIHQTAGIIDKINICNAIERWVIDHDSIEPIIVIDLKGFSYNSLVNDDMNIFLGIQSSKYNRKMIQFFEKLQNAGARLVFFMVGRRDTDDAYWDTFHNIINEYNKEYQEYISIMDKMERFSILTDGIIFSTSLTHTMQFNLQHICQKIESSQFYVTHKIHNREIGEFLTENDSNVMAIISDDSDFMAIDGQFEYWSLGSLDFREMNCYRYSKAELKSKLNLKSKKIHSINVLSGDLTDYPLGKGFKEKLSEIEEWFKAGEENLQEWNEDFLEFCKNDHPTMYILLMYRVLKLKEMASVDHRKFLSCFADLIIPIVMKICGVLNKDAPVRPLTRQIFAKFSHDESWTLKDEEIIYPKMELPPLTDLVIDHEERKFDHYRHWLFNWILGFDDNMLILKLRNLEQPNHIKVTILTLQYLLNKRELQPDEAYVILLTELEQLKPSEQYRVVYPQNTDINAHFVHIAHFFPKVYVWVNHALDVCGLAEMIDLIHFDGPAFHNMMIKFEKAAELEKENMRSTVKPIWTFE